MNKLVSNPSYKYFSAFFNLFPASLRGRLKSVKLWFLFDLFRWLIIDLGRPHFFHPYGLYFITGLPGNGKTIYLTYLLSEYRRKYGDTIYIITNFGWIGEDYSISSYTDLLTIFDKPVIVGYDEIQNDFDGRDWEKIDRDFSKRITQTRKMKGMMILGTAQKFGFVDRRLRQLTRLVYDCRIIGNRLDLIRIYEPEIKEKLESGIYNEDNKMMNRGFKAFVQSDYYRNLYSSYEFTKTSADKLNTLFKKSSISSGAIISNETQTIQLQNRPI